MEALWCADEKDGGEERNMEAIDEKKNKFVILRREWENWAFVLGSLSISFALLVQVLQVH